MKILPRKLCRSINVEASKMVWRGIVTPPLPARRCASLKTASPATAQPGLVRICALLAAGWTLAGASVSAVSTSSALAKDTDARIAAPVAVPDAPAPGEAAPKGVTPSAPQNHLAPALPTASSIFPDSVEEDIRDIRSPRHLPSRWPWGAGAAGAFALAGIAYAVWKRRFRKAMSPQLPYELALGRLEHARCLMTPEQAREFCFAVSEVIRGYIEQRFKVRAPRRTTEEFLYHLLEEKHVMLTSQRTLLAEFLQHCDMAKFALWQFSVPEMEAMHLSARTFVLQTALEPAASDPARTNEPSLPKSPRVRLDPPGTGPRHAAPKPA